MSYPAGWDLVNVTGTYIAKDGVPCVGSVVFSSPQMVLRSGTIVPAADIVFTLDATGKFSGQIPATDDPNATPSGWLYTVTENVPGGRSGFLIAAPHTSPGIDLSTVVPVIFPVPPASQYPLATLQQLAAESAPTGASLIGFLQSGTGAIGETLQTKLQEWVSVKDFGAKGDGTTDDTAAIQAALNAAGALRANLLFPAGNYRTSATLTVAPNINGILSLGAMLQSLGAPGDCISFGASNFVFNDFVLPSISEYTNGYGCVFAGASLARVSINTIQACKGGIKFLTASASNSVLDNTVDVFTLAQLTESAITYVSFSSGSAMQGNVVRSNFVSACACWVLAQGAASAGINFNYHECAAIDATDATNGIAINGGGVFPGTNVFEVLGFWGGFTGSPVVTAIGNGNKLKLLGMSGIEYGDFSINGVGNYVETPGAGGYRVPGVAIAAATASNSRATWNGGVAVYQPLINLSFAIPAMAAGATIDFYAYSPFTDGYSDLFSLVPHFAQPLVVQVVEDESVLAGTDGNTVANQIHIRLLAVLAVAASTQYGTLMRAT